MRSKCISLIKVVHLFRVVYHFKLMKKQTENFNQQILVDFFFIINELFSIDLDPPGLCGLGNIFDQRSNCRISFRHNLT